MCSRPYVYIRITNERQCLPLFQMESHSSIEISEHREHMVLLVPHRTINVFLKAVKNS